MKYIPADKLLAEIDRRIEACRQKVAAYEKNGDNISASIEGLEAASLISFRSFIASLQQEQPETDLLEESYMRGFAQGAKEERESLSHTMLTYAAEVFSGKMLLEDISYSYRQELADYFNDLVKTGKEE